MPLIRFCRVCDRLTGYGFLFRIGFSHVKRALPLTRILDKPSLTDLTILCPYMNPLYVADSDTPALCYRP